VTASIQDASEQEQIARIGSGMAYPSRISATILKPEAGDWLIEKMRGRFDQITEASAGHWTLAGDHASLNVIRNDKSIEMRVQSDWEAHDPAWGFKQPALAGGADLTVQGFMRPHHPKGFAVAVGGTQAAIIPFTSVSIDLSGGEVHVRFSGTPAGKIPAQAMRGQPTVDASAWD